MCWAIILLSLLPSQGPAEMDYLLRNIPDANVKTSDSSSAKLSSWYSQKPVVLTLVYGRCPGVCNPYLLQIRDQVSLLGAEKKFQMMVLSFDPEDDPGQLCQLAGFTDENPPPANWTFGILEEESRTDLVSALGFQTQVVGELYDHNTVLILISKDGNILQWIEGLPNNGQWDRLFKELTNEFIPVYPTLGSDVWTSCFRYDPASGNWRLNWGLLMILAPSVITVCIIIILQLVTRYERRNQSLPIENQP